MPKIDWQTVISVKSIWQVHHKIDAIERLSSQRFEYDCKNKKDQ